MASELRWQTETPGVWLALTPGKLYRVMPTRRDPAGSKLLYRFAVVRAARDAGGLHNPATGSWVASLVGKLPAGVTAFDMITEHETLDAAKLHIEALYALEGG
jgi:hypothetical protein